MTPTPLTASDSIARYELRFQSLFHTGRGLSFPCDAAGRVQWEAMSDGARASFLRAQQGSDNGDIVLEAVDRLAQEQLLLLLCRSGLLLSELGLMERSAQFLNESCQEETEHHERQPSELVSRLSDPEGAFRFQPQCD